MQTLADNFVIRFLKITKKKDGIFADFKVKGVRGGVCFTASISVDLLGAGLDPAEDPVEKIVEVCAKIAVKEFRKAEFQFEGIENV